MNAALSIELRDGASAALNALLDRARPEAVVAAIAEDVNTFIQAHLRQLDTDRPNKMSGVRTNYWGRMAAATHPTAQGDTLTISIGDAGSPGMRQHYEGGTITGNPWLTIPARAEAHGKRAREFNNLRFIRFSSETAALVVKAGGETGRRRVRGAKGFSNKKSGIDEGMILFWLKHSVTQKADPSVLPTSSEILARAIRSAEAFIQGGNS